MYIGNTRIGGIGSLSVKNTYDPDALAYLTRVEAADGQALENSVKIAVNRFVVNCKAQGGWNPIKSCCILAGARTLSGALVPLVGTAPTNTGFVSGDYSRANGLTGDGSTKWINSNRANNADPQNDKHILINLTATYITSGNKMFAGSENASGGSSIRALNLNQISGRANSSGNSNIDWYEGLGLTGVSRYEASYIAGFSNGNVQNVAFTNISTTPTSTNIGIFADGNGTTKSNIRLSFYSIGTAIHSVSGTQAFDAINTNLQALMTAFSTL
jgi:hypothetical protein